jgi:hypothetical protein
MTLSILSEELRFAIEVEGRSLLCFPHLEAPTDSDPFVLLIVLNALLSAVEARLEARP